MGGSASRISNTSRPTDPGGGSSSTATRVRSNWLISRCNRLLVEPVKTAMVTPWVTSEPGQGSLPNGVADVSEEISKMRHAHQQEHS